MSNFVGSELDNFSSFFILSKYEQHKGCRSQGICMKLATQQKFLRNFHNNKQLSISMQYKIMNVHIEIERIISDYFFETS